MFQVAATIATSLKYKIPYCIPKHTLNDKVWKPYYFENVNYCDDNDVISVQKVWKEPSHAYHEIPMPTRSIVLDGYFQSELYFKDYLPEIRKVFGFDKLEIKRGVCSIHVRRGDYLLYPDKHPVVTGEYLKQAMLGIIDKTNIRHFKIFGDDIEWNKSHFNIIGDYYKFEFSENKNEIEDIKEMASCEHNIISNSTFSWWSAYLNNNPDKIVITPDESNWFGVKNKHLSVKDLLPESWIRIKY